MSARGEKLVKYLIEYPEVTLAELEVHFNLSSRQINYSLKKLNEKLAQLSLPLVERNYQGKFLLNPKTIHYFSPASSKEFKESGRAQNYTEEERKRLLLLYLLIQPSFISLSHICLFLDVSKTTAVNDIKYLEMYLEEEHQLFLTYTRKDGYQIIGNELQIRLLINTAITNVLAFEEKILDICYEMGADKVTLDAVIHLILTIENRLEIRYSDDAINHLKYVLLSIISRIKSDVSYDMTFFQNNINDTKEYSIVKKEISEAMQITTESDVEWITLLFLAANIYRGNKIHTFVDHDLTYIVKKMIELFEQKTLIQIKNKPQFISRLLGHLRPACFRVKYGIQVADIGLDKLIRNNQHLLFVELMKEIIVPLENYLQTEFPADELELLSFYFGSEIDFTKTVFTAKKRAGVVCTNGTITSRIMIETLKNIFPEFHFLSALSVREFFEYQHDYDVIFTNIPLQTETKQYVVGLLSNYSEQVRLRYRVLHDLGFMSVDEQIDGFLKIIKKHTRVVNETALKADLIELILQQTSQEQLHQELELPHLRKYIRLENIQFVEEKLTWQEAIERACQPLLINNDITQEYVSEIIQQYYFSENYNFFGKYMAIPHASNEFGVSQDAISLLISKEPIMFPNGNEIYIIAPIAIKNDGMHLRAVTQLADWATSSTIYEQIFTQFQNHEEIYKIINEMKG